MNRNTTYEDQARFAIYPRSETNSRTDNNSAKNFDANSGTHQRASRHRGFWSLTSVFLHHRDISLEAERKQKQQHVLEETPKSDLHYFLAAMCVKVPIVPAHKDLQENVSWEQFILQTERLMPTYEVGANFKATPNCPQQTSSGERKAHGGQSVHADKKTSVKYKWKCFCLCFAFDHYLLTSDDIIWWRVWWTAPQEILSLEKSSCDCCTQG